LSVHEKDDEAVPAKDYVKRSSDEERWLRRVKRHSLYAKVMDELSCRAKDNAALRQGIAASLGKELWGFVKPSSSDSE
jgi:ribosomal protein S21